jgi:hypothetical protein
MRNSLKVFIAISCVFIMASSASANLYVTLQTGEGGKVVSVDETTGAVTDVVTTGGSHPLHYPLGIAYSPARQEFYVADDTLYSFPSQGSLTIQRYTLGGTFLGSFLGGNHDLYNGGLACDASGNVFVAGSTGEPGYMTGQIREYRWDGTPVASWSPAVSPEHFYPFAMAADPSGNLFTTDLDGSEIWKFTPGLASQSVFKALDGNPWATHKGIAVDGNYNVYSGHAPDPFQGQHFGYDSSGNLISNPDNAKLGGTADALGPDGYLYTLNAPGIYRLNVPSMIPDSYFTVNSTPLSGAAWMTEVPEPSNLWLIGVGLVSSAIILIGKVYRQRSRPYSTVSVSRW